MKKFLTFPVITITIIALLVVITLFSGGFKFNMINPKEPKMFITTTLPKFSNPWDANIMNQYISGIEPEKIDTLCSDLQTMFGGCSIKDITWQGTQVNTGTFYTYLVDLSCEKGNAKAGLTLTEKDADYKYVGLNVLRGI